jgi:Fe-S-cluster-containing hydrogenase component 2
MAYTITSECIDCDRCQFVCPTKAIQLVGNQYRIDSSLCNNCVGDYSTPQCWAVCPTNTGCIPVVTPVVSHPSQLPSDYWEKWFSTYNRIMVQLHKAQHSEYWEQWFDLYSQKLKTLMQQNVLQNSSPPSIVH